jgi:methionine-rich copper-binding protein CopC
VDAATNPYDGITSETALSFTTAAAVVPDTTNPLLASSTPADDAVDVAVGANIVLTFDEIVNVGTGDITIKKTSDDTIVEAIAVDGLLVTGDGTTTITVNPTADLDNSIEYYVLIDATAFVDAATNPYDGITSETALSFTTVDAASDFFFDESAVSKVVGAEQFTRNATDDETAGTGLITYSSGTPATATVNETTGEVTIVAAGTTTISVTKAASVGFTTTTKTYLLTVTAAPVEDGGSDDSSSSTTSSLVPVNNPPTSSKWLKLTNNVLEVNFASQNEGKIVKIYNNQNQKTVLVGFAKLDKFGNATLTLKEKVLPGSLFAMIDKKIKNVITVK